MLCFESLIFFDHVEVIIVLDAFIFLKGNLCLLEFFEQCVEHVFGCLPRSLHCFYLQLPGPDVNARETLHKLIPEVGQVDHAVVRGILLVVRPVDLRDLLLLVDLVGTVVAVADQPPRSQRRDDVLDVLQLAPPELPVLQVASERDHGVAQCLDFDVILLELLQFGEEVFHEVEQVRVQHILCRLVVCVHVVE